MLLCARRPTLLAAVQQQQLQQRRASPTAACCCARSRPSLTSSSSARASAAVPPQHIRRSTVVIRASAVQQPCRPTPQLSLEEKGWVRLLDHVAEKTAVYSKLAVTGRPRQEAALAALEDLLSPEAHGLFAHLNRELQGLKVRFKDGPQHDNVKDLQRGIAWLDPRWPADIHHADILGFLLGSCSTETVTVAAATERRGIKLQHPRLPCIAVLHPSWKKDNADSEPSSWYQHIPLECCWVKPDKHGKLPRNHSGCTQLADCRLPGVPEEASRKQCLLPVWVEELFSQAASSADSPSSTSTADSPGSSSTSSPSDSPSSTSSPSDSPSSTSNSSSPADSPSSCPSASSSSSALNTGVNASELALASKPAVEAARRCFERLTAQLHPTATEEAVMGGYVKEVHAALMRVATDKPWTASLQVVGSRSKGTAVRGWFDLDLLVVLSGEEQEQADFDINCTQVLAGLQDELCSPRGRFKPSAVHHELFLRLYSQDAQYSLDIQVCPSLHASFRAAADSTPAAAAVGRQVLQAMIQHQQHRRQRGAAKPPQYPDSEVAQTLIKPAKSIDRARMPLLTPLFDEVVRGMHLSIEEQFGLQGAGALVSGVIRLTKAWIKHGFLAGLADSSSSSSSSSSSQGPADAAAVKIPGVVCEVFVIYVLRRRLRQLQADAVPLQAAAWQQYRIGGIRELVLFMDVLHGMSVLLGPAGPEVVDTPPPAIFLTDYYSADECELFRDTWGAGPPYRVTPFIIHPANPSYNITSHTQFKAWDALADAAGELHGHLSQFLMQTDGGQAQAQLPSGGSDGGGVDVWWQAVLDGTSLGPVARVFESG